MELFLLFGCLAMAIILAVFVDPLFILKVAIIYLGASLGTLVLVRLFPTTNEIPGLMIMGMFGTALLLLCWHALWQTAEFKPRLAEYRQFQTNLWTQIVTWLS